MTEHYDPKGWRFHDRHLGECKLIQEGHSAGWICRRGAEGQWVTVREASQADIDKIAEYRSRACR